MGWSMFSAAIPWDHLQHRAHQLPCIHCHHQECLQNAIGSLTHIAATPGPALLFEELLAWASWNKIIAFQSQVSDVIHQEFQRSQLGKMKNANKNTIQKVRSALVNGSSTCSSSCRISFHRRWSTLVACKVGIENSTPSTRKAAESKSPSESQCAASTPFQMAVCRSSGHYSLAFLATRFSDDLPCRVHLMCVDASIDWHKVLGRYRFLMLNNQLVACEKRLGIAAFIIPGTTSKKMQPRAWWIQRIRLWHIYLH